MNIKESLTTLKKISLELSSLAELEEVLASLINLENEETKIKQNISQKTGELEALSNAVSRMEEKHNILTGKISVQRKRMSEEKTQIMKTSSDEYKEMTRVNNLKFVELCNIHDAKEKSLQANVDGLSSAINIKQDELKALQRRADNFSRDAKTVAGR